MTRWLILPVIIGAPLMAAEATLDLDPGRTKVAITLGDVLHTVHGTFQMERGSITFDPSTGMASGEIVVNVASGDSGAGARDKRMHKEILESARYPEAIFKPDRVEGTFANAGESQLDVHGTFTIHGSSHDVTFHFRIQSAGDTVSAVTNLKIPYVQWGMKNPSNFLLRVNDTVDMTIQATGRLR